jgi:hypothetical protein
MIFMPFSFKQKQEESPLMSLLEVALVPFLYLPTLFAYTTEFANKSSI